MHLGAKAPVVLAAPPPTVSGTRRGGTDAANAASWRPTAQPVGLPAKPSGSGGAPAALYLESFDMPGHVLAPSSAAAPTAAGAVPTTGALPVALVRASASDLSQQWIASKGADGQPTLENALRRGHILCVQRRPVEPAQPSGAPPAGLVVPHRGVAISREWSLVLAPPDGRVYLPAAVHHEEAFAAYAPTSFWLTSPAAPAAAEPAGVRPFLLMPLNEMQDEHYTVYFCKPGSASEAAKPPRHCV